ncbi:MAG: ComEC/Rec2 family competence protein [Anaerolineales bacterium]
MPLFWISLAFLSGILLAPSLNLPLLGWSLLALLIFILLFPPISRRLSSRLPTSFTRLAENLKLSSSTMFLLVILFLSIGAIRYQLDQPTIDPSFIAYYNDQSTETIMDGVLVEPPDVRDTFVNLRLRIDQLHQVNEDQFIPVQGLLLVRVSTSTSFLYGDRIRLQGHPETPPENEDFSYRDYLANQGIFSYISYPSSSLLQHGEGNPIYSALYAFRQHALDVVYSLFPDPEASLLAGILLGVQSGIPQDVQDAFRLTGTSHIIVISGFNITIIAGLFTFMFSRLLGERRGAIVAAIGIIFYTLLVGANPAVVRAAILGMLTLLGHQVGRRQVGLNSLAIVGAAMAFVTPTVLWDVSFQLSFAATLGIMLYAEPFTNWFINFAARFIPHDKAHRLAGPVGEYFLLTLAAQLTTLPLMIYYFKRISFTSLIANPLILPAQPPLMVLGGLSVLTGMIIKPIGQLLAWATWPFTAYTIRMVEWLSDVPHGSIPLGQIAFPLILLFYAVLFTLTFARPRLTGMFARLSPAIPLTIMGVLTIMIWKAAFYAPDGLLHVTILDIGTGDAVLIQTPTGRSVLINGGPSTVRLSDTLGRRLPPFNRTLDWLVVADIDNEDLSGLTGNLERFTPANVLWSGNTYGTRSATELWTALLTTSTPITRMQSGQSLDLGSGASMQVLSIDPRGAVLFLEWENFRLLLPMGMDFNTLDNLQHNSSMRNISAVLLGESGYAPLNPPDLLSFLHPQLALLSVAAADKTGLPSPETLNALQGYTLLRTDQNGWIELTSDGKQMWVELERK